MAFTTIISFNIRCWIFVLLPMLHSTQGMFLPFPMTMISFDIPHHQSGHSSNNLTIQHFPPQQPEPHNDDGPPVDDNSESESNIVTQTVVTESCHKCTCGIINRKMRIVGGVPTEQNEFPWMASLSKKGKFYCGATIITKFHLLTAAHCVEGFTPREIKATIGEYNRALKNDTRRQVVRIKEIIRHPGFQISNFRDDIAVLKVDKEMTFGTPYVQPACLPAYENRDYTGIVATVTGWGRLGESKPTSNEMRKVDVPIMSMQDCRQNSGYVPTRITDNMMCAGYANGQKDSCQGDSGGPLQIPGNRAGTMEVVGIVSWGRGCARPNFPGVYTKIANYMDWVDSNVEKQCTCKG